MHPHVPSSPVPSKYDFEEKMCKTKKWVINYSFCAYQSLPWGAPQGPCVPVKWQVCSPRSHLHIANIFPVEAIRSWGKHNAKNVLFNWYPMGKKKNRATTGLNVFARALHCFWLIMLPARRSHNKKSKFCAIERILENRNPGSKKTFDARKSWR